jgi:hypothetical protein
MKKWNAAEKAIRLRAKPTVEKPQLTASVASVGPERQLKQRI